MTCDKQTNNKGSRNFNKIRITQMYFTKMSKTVNKRLKHGRLDEINNKVKMRSNLIEDIQIVKPLIRQRIKKDLFV